MKVTFRKKFLIILCLYRAPSEDFEYFIDHLEEILQSLHNPKTHIILCGDFNVDFSRSNNLQTQMLNLFNMFNLKGTVSFHTRITSTSSTMIDNIVIDNNSSYTICPWINGLSDYDAQILCLKVPGRKTSQPTFIYTRNLSEYNITSFLHCLSHEQWFEVFEENDINKMFNNFLKVYIRYHQSNFPVVKRYTSIHTLSPWITKGIVISCRRKKELFILSKILNDQRLTKFYKQYCTILSKVINAAKKLHNNSIISSAGNKIKATWRIINREKGKTKSNTLTKEILHEGNVICDQSKIANLFNKYSLLNLVWPVQGTNNNNVKINITNSIEFLDRHYEKPFPAIKWQFTSTHEIINIIRTMKTTNSAGYDEI